MKYENESIQLPKCSVCKSVKGNSNHWWHMDVIDGGLILKPMNVFNYKSLFVCGVECAVSVMNEYMSDALKGGFAIKPPGVLNNFAKPGAGEDLDWGRTDPLHILTNKKQPNG